MKILSNQAAKATRMTSNSSPKDFPNELLLSSYHGGMLQENSSRRDKHFAIATENLKFDCGIQDEEMRKSFTHFFGNRKITFSDGLTIYQLPPHVLRSGVYDFNSDGLITSTTRLQDKGTPTTAQTREYRKSLSLKLGSLNLSLDLVMVVKSKSNSKSLSRLNSRSSLKDAVNICSEEKHLLETHRNINDVLI